MKKNTNTYKNKNTLQEHLLVTQDFLHPSLLSDTLQHVLIQLFWNTDRWSLYFSSMYMLYLSDTLQHVLVQLFWNPDRCISVPCTCCIYSILAFSSSITDVKSGYSSAHSPTIRRNMYNINIHWNMYNMYITVHWNMYNMYITVQGTSGYV